MIPSCLCCHFRECFGGRFMLGEDTDKIAVAAFVVGTGKNAAKTEAAMCGEHRGMVEDMRKEVRQAAAAGGRPR